MRTAPLAAAHAARPRGGRAPWVASCVVAGGLVAGDQSTATAYRLDPANGHVQPLRRPAGTACTTPPGVLLGGRPVVLGGGNASEQDVVQVRRRGRLDASAGTCRSARSDLAAVTVAGRALVIGGYDAVTPAVPAVLASRDGASWLVVGALPVPVRYAAGVAQGGAVWLFGGERSGAQQTAVQRIDATTGKAQVVTHLPRPLGHAAAIAFGRRVLLAGGRTGSDVDDEPDVVVRPRDRRFSRAGRLPVPLADTAVAVVGGDRGYLVGGESPLVTDRVVRLRLR